MFTLFPAVLFKVKIVIKIIVFNKLQKTYLNSVFQQNGKQSKAFSGIEITETTQLQLVQTRTSKQSLFYFKKSYEFPLHRLSSYSHHPDESTSRPWNARRLRARLEGGLSARWPIVLRARHDTHRRRQWQPPAHHHTWRCYRQRQRHEWESHKGVGAWRCWSRQRRVPRYGAWYWCRWGFKGLSRGGFKIFVIQTL